MAPLKMKNNDNPRLLRAFPSSIQSVARSAISYLPEDKYFQRIGWYNVAVAGEQISIPRRIYHNPSQIAWWRIWGEKKEVLGSLLTRHADGFTRQRYLQRIIRLDRAWIPPFVILLAGEYVVEILDVIWEHRAFLNRVAYAEFLNANGNLVQKTEQRIQSYWDCYYKSIPRKEYVGFRLLKLFRSLTQVKAESNLAITEGV